MTTNSLVSLDRYIRAVEHMDTLAWSGVVTEYTGLVIRSRGPMCAVGDRCEIQTAVGSRIQTQVVGFENDQVLMVALQETEGLRSGDRVIARGGDSSVAVGPELLGRVVDAFGRPIDNGPAIRAAAHYPIFAGVPGPLTRRRITNPLVTGIRAIDGLLTCGKGQRIGIFGGSGVGKSTLLGSMCRNNFADVTVICLVGERNREVMEFVERDLGPEGLKRAVLVVATSDRPAPLRVNACFTACAIAEYFRDQGADVLLVMDSVTRLAMAQREIGLAAGEPPSQKGYTPSVFALLPKVFERAGNFHKGSITGFFTVLVEGDDFNEPICDAVRAILDGHIVLSRRLGAAGHYPAIDVLESVSRLASEVATPDQKKYARVLREAIATYQSSAELIQLGAYVSGSNPQLDTYIREMPTINQFLRQTPDAKFDMATTLRAMGELNAKIR
jgi:FliI/YscN family ATPase